MKIEFQKQSGLEDLVFSAVYQEIKIIWINT